MISIFYQALEEGQCLCKIKVMIEKTNYQDKSHSLQYNQNNCDNCTTLDNNKKTQTYNVHVLLNVGNYQLLYFLSAERLYR